MAISAVSRSRISPTMMNVGILAEKRAQRAGEGEPDLRIDVQLVDAPISYSTGSSAVRMFNWGRLMRFSAA